MKVKNPSVKKPIPRETLRLIERLRDRANKAEGERDEARYQTSLVASERDKAVADKATAVSQMHQAWRERNEMRGQHERGLSVLALAEASAVEKERERARAAKEAKISEARVAEREAQMAEIAHQNERAEARARNAEADLERVTGERDSLRARLAEREASP